MLQVSSSSTVTDKKIIDCSLQPQQPREVSSVDFIQFSSAAAAPMNPPPPRAIALTELLKNHNRKMTNVVPSTGLLRSSQDHSQNQEQLLSTFSILPGEFKRQRNYLDMFLQTQREELRRKLASNRQRQYVELLYAAEELVRRRVREKEAELEKSTRRHAELEARASHLAEEARTWQLRAATREAEVSTLQAHIQKAIASRRAAANQSTIGGDGDDAESVFVDPERIESIGPSCRICRRKPAVVMALPCRHLVLCKVCDGGGAVRACSICLADKSTGVEVLFS
ncbi:hypothetical protein Bca4012_023739 [Brassica carinata]